MLVVSLVRIVAIDLGSRATSCITVDCRPNLLILFNSAVRAVPIIPHAVFGLVNFINDVTFFLLVTCTELRFYK